MRQGQAKQANARRSKSRWWICPALLGAIAAPGQIQQNSPVYTAPGLRQPSAASGNPNDAPPPPFGTGISPMRLERMREEDRHKRLLADTARLVELTNELKVDVEKAAKNELSIEVVKKAAEIEKLARDVKDRMRN